MSLLVRIRDSAKRIYAYCVPLRFSFLALAVLAFAFWFSDQGWDIQRALVEDDVPTAPARIFFFLFFTFLLALEIWYWSRHMLRYRPHAKQPDDPCRDRIAEPLVEDAINPDDRVARFVVDRLPRLLGALVFVIEIISLMLVRWQYKGVSPRHYWVTIFFLAVFLVVYLLFVVKRHDWWHVSHDSRTTTIRTRAKFDPVTRHVLRATFAIEIALFIWALVDPVSWWLIGACAVLVLTIAVWVPFGSLLVAAGEWLQIPILLLILLWAFAWSPVTARNHRIRELRGTVPARPSLDVAFEQWKQRSAGLPRDASGNVPAIVVATEGGGVRAAYWTAQALATLQDELPTFRQHLFAVSGVSGGSGGAVVFDALLARRANLHQPLSGGLRSDVHNVLQFDALSGTLASMAQPDFLQRFFPPPILPDRAQALEKGWERGWSKEFKGDEFFSTGFLALFAAHPDLPLLFLNGTTVEMGDRIVTSPVDFQPNPEFRNAHDSLAKFGPNVDLRLSTASLMSARFTYFSPAGRVPNRDPLDKETADDRSVFGNVVDGGYFENSGAVTASEIVAYLRRKGGVTPYVIFIDFSDAACRNSLETPYCPAFNVNGPPPPLHPMKFAGEVMSPLFALLNSRDARGNQAIGDAVTATGRVVEFRLVQHQLPLPLGWVLSREAMAAIDSAMPCDVRNRAGISLIGAVIGQTPQPMQCEGKAVTLPPPQATACVSGRCL